MVCVEAKTSTFTLETSGRVMGSCALAVRLSLGLCSSDEPEWGVSGVVQAGGVH